MQNISVEKSQLISSRIYWIGPILGTLLASGFYKFMKMLEYENANPGQDHDAKEQADSKRDKIRDRSESIVTLNQNHNAYDEHERNRLGVEQRYHDPSGKAKFMTKEQLLKDAFTDGPFSEAALITPRHDGPARILA